MNAITATDADRRCAGTTRGTAANWRGRRCQIRVATDWKGSLVTADGRHWCHQHASQAPAEVAPALVLAAETPRDEVTVHVAVDPATLLDGDVPDAEDDEQDSPMQCNIFGHELAGGRCEVCGEPDPAIAAVLTDAADHPVTVAAEPGGFGAALGVLGFGEGERGDSWTEGIYWAFDHDTALVRVVCYPDDGDRVTLIGWDPKRPAARLVAWKASFDGSTPQTVVLTALAAVLGVLPVTR